VNRKKCQHKKKKIIITKDIKENVIEIVIICRLVLEEASKKLLMQQKFMRKDKRNKGKLTDKK
jgi:hypothetical protein